MRSLILCLLLSLTSLSARARTFKDVTMPDSLTVDGHTLVLNGMGMRFVVKFGLDINVYVGALYLEKKSTDSDAILNSDGVKRLVMHYVRSVDRDPILDAFHSAYDNSCFVACDKKEDQFAKFAPYIVEVRKGNECVLTFYKDKVEVDTNGPYGKKATITDAALSRNLLSVFINKKSPPGKKFREGLLGI